MMYEYTTVDDAMRAVDIAVEETLNDQPHLREYEGDVFHDIVQAIAMDCSPSVAAELSRVTGVPL